MFEIAAISMFDNLLAYYTLFAMNKHSAMNKKEC